MRGEIPSYSSHTSSCFSHILSYFYTFFTYFFIFPAYSFIFLSYFYMFFTYFPHIPLYFRLILHITFHTYFLQAEKERKKKVSSYIFFTYFFMFFSYYKNFLSPKIKERGGDSDFGISVSTRIRIFLKIFRSL